MIDLLKLFGNSDYPALAVDAQQRVVMWNPSAEAVLGFDTGDVLGNFCYQVFTVKDILGRTLCQRDCSICHQVARGGFIADRQVMFQHKSGRFVRMVCTVAALPAGSEARAIIHFREAGARKLKETVTPLSDDNQPDQILEPQPQLQRPVSVAQALAALNNINAVATRCSDLSQALNSALDAVLGATHAEAAEIFLREEQSGDMVLTAYRGPFRGAFYQITRFTVGEGFPGLVAATAEPIITLDLSQDRRYLRSKVKQKGFQSYICVPLIDERGVVGCLNVASRHREEDVLSRLQFLSWAANPLSAAIQLSWVRAQDLIARYQAEPVAGLESNLDQALNYILETMLATGQADGGGVMLCHPLGKTLGRRVTRGFFEDTRCCGFPRGEATICPALAMRKAVLLSGPRYTWEQTCKAAHQEMNMVVCVPMVAESVMGVITLGYRRPSTLPPTRYLGILSAMAARAALVVKNVQHYLQSQELAISAERDHILSELEGMETHSRPSGAEKQRDVAGKGLSERPTPLDIRCFGHFQIYRDGELLTPSTFPRRKALTALKILITYRGRPVSKEALIEYLWPEADPGAGSDRLYVVIHSLRRHLEPHKGARPLLYILTEGDSYYFNTGAPYRLDVDEFLQGVNRGRGLEAQGSREQALAAYRAAAQLYAGDFLEEERYSDWCSSEREHLRERYLALLKKIASLLTEEGDLEACVNYYRRALLVDNLREEMHRELMRCLWRAGRRDEALRQYLVCRQLLADELGVAPLPETEDLYLQILGDRREDSNPKSKMR